MEVVFRLGNYHAFLARLEFRNVNIERRIEQLAQCFGDIFPGTVAGNIGYTNTTGQTTTWNIPASPAVPAGSEAICMEEAQFMRHVLDYRSFSTAAKISYMIPTIILLRIAQYLMMDHLTIQNISGKLCYMVRFLSRVQDQFHIHIYQ